MCFRSFVLHTDVQGNLKQNFEIHEHSMTSKYDQHTKFYPSVRDNKVKQIMFGHVQRMEENRFPKGYYI